MTGCVYGWGLKFSCKDYFDWVFTFPSITSTVGMLLLLLFSCYIVSDALWPHGLQHTRFPCPSPSPGVFANSRPLSQWCYPTILSSVIPFSSCFQSFPASGYFPVSWLFIPGGQSIGASASVSVLLVNIQGGFPSGLTGLIFLLSKWLSKVFSSTTIQKHQFFNIQLSLWSKWVRWRT